MIIMTEKVRFRWIGYTNAYLCMLFGANILNNVLKSIDRGEEKRIQSKKQPKKEKKAPPLSKR